MALFSLILIPKNWRHIDKKIFGEVGLAIVFGFIIGFQVLKYGNPLILKKEMEKRLKKVYDIQRRFGNKRD